MKVISAILIRKERATNVITHSSSFQELELRRIRWRSSEFESPDEECDQRRKFSVALNSPRSYWQQQRLQQKEKQQQEMQHQQQHQQHQQQHQQHTWNVSFKVWYQSRFDEEDIFPLLNVRRLPVEVVLLHCVDAWYWCEVHQVVGFVQPDAADSESLRILGKFEK